MSTDAQGDVRIAADALAAALLNRSESVQRRALKWPNEVAAALGVGRDFLRDYGIAGELRIVRRGSVRLVSIAELDRWLDEHSTTLLEDSKGEQ